MGPFSRRALTRCSYWLPSDGSLRGIVVSYCAATERDPVSSAVSRDLVLSSLPKGCFAGLEPATFRSLNQRLYPLGQAGYWLEVLLNFYVFILRVRGFPVTSLRPQARVSWLRGIAG